MCAPADVPDLSSLVPSFATLLQPFRSAMTAPTFASLVTVLGGWVMARRRTVTGALACGLAAAAAAAAAAAGDAAGPGTSAAKHHSAYHRLFAAARWSLDAVGLGVLGLILCLALAGGATVFLAVDDTLCRRRGRRVWGAGMHYDPLLTGRKWSAARKAVKSRGHCWVVLGVVLPLACRSGHYYCLPVLFRLYLNQKSARRHRTPYRTRPALARELLTLACAAHPGRRFHLLCDSAYAGQDTLRSLPANCDLTARWPAKAVLHAPAPAGRRPGSAGRPRVRGDRLPSPGQMLDDRCDRRTFDGYGLRGTYRVASCRACLYAVPGRLLRVVATEPLTGGGRPRPRDRAAFYSTCVDATPERVLAWYALRWSIEVTFRDAKQDLGLQDPQGWTEPAARRTAPTLLLLLGLVVLWFDRAGGHAHHAPPRRPWYPARPAAAAAFRDMLATLRDQALRAFFATLPADRSPENPAHALLRLLRLAS